MFIGKITLNYKSEIDTIFFSFSLLVKYISKKKAIIYCRQTKNEYFQSVVCGENNVLFSFIILRHYQLFHFLFVVLVIFTYFFFRLQFFLFLLFLSKFSRRHELSQHTRIYTLTNIFLFIYSHIQIYIRVKELSTI